MPVIGSLKNPDYYTHEYIPSVSAVIEYFNTSGLLSAEFGVNDVTKLSSSNTNDNTLYIDNNNACAIKNNNEVKVLSLPVIDSLRNSDYYTHEYIPSVSAVIEYISTMITTTANETENSSEVFVKNIAYQENGSNYAWTNNELSITHNLLCQYPNVQIFVSDVNSSKYVCKNLSWYVNDGDANTVYIDCSEYTDKLITVKITK
jgi:hypothetical protein